VFVTSIASFKDNKGNYHSRVVLSGMREWRNWVSLHAIMCCKIAPLDADMCNCGALLPASPSSTCLSLRLGPMQPASAPVFDELDTAQVQQIAGLMATRLVKAMKTGAKQPMVGSDLSSLEQDQLWYSVNLSSSTPKRASSPATSSTSSAKKQRSEGDEEA
jgi:hypothetical protein